MIEKKTKPVVFVAKNCVKYAVKLFKLDENGKKIERKNRFGEAMLDKSGNAIPVMYDVEFKPQVTNVKLGTYCIYEATKPDEISQLMEMAESSDPTIVTYEQYEREQNPKAFDTKKDYEKKLAAEKEAKEKAELAGLEKDDVIKKQAAEIEKLKKGVR